MKNLLKVGQEIVAILSLSLRVFLVVTFPARQKTTSPLLPSRRTFLMSLRPGPSPTAVMAFSPFAAAGKKSAQNIARNQVRKNAVNSPKKAAQKSASLFTLY